MCIRDSNGNIVQFFSWVTGGTGVYSYVWNFGDGNISQQSHPIHNYGTSGMYTYRLTVWDSLANCTDTLIGTIILNNTNTNTCNVQAIASDSIINGNIVQFYGWATGGTSPYSYFWDFGDGNFSQQQHPFHSYGTNGTYTYRMWVTDSLGCQDTIIQTITINNTNSCNVQVIGGDSVIQGLSLIHI